MDACVRFTKAIIAVQTDERNLLGKYLCTIKITHGKNTKGGEIPAVFIKKTEKIFKQEGLKWPPKKK
jgi:hypothetical protein